MVDSILTSFALATVYIFIPSVPVTHGLGLLAHLPTRAKTKHLFLYPLKGGRNHLIFEIVSWTAWGAAVLVAFPVVAQSQFPLPQSRVELLTSVAAVGGVTAELFMVKSLLVFEPANRPQPRTASGRLAGPGSPRFKPTLVSPPLASVAVMVMGGVWSIMGGGLLLAFDSMQDASAKHTHLALSAMCLLIGALTTHGLGGRLRHMSAKEGMTEMASTWHFWQPFSGGTAFVATQALGWALFAVALSSMVWLGAQVAYGIAFCVQCWQLMIMTSSFMLGAQLVLGLSIFFFKRKELKQGVRTTFSWLSWERLVGQWDTWAPIMMFYTPVHIFSTVFTVTCLVLPLNYVAALWIGGFIVYFLVTATGAPEHTGRREWPWLQEWVLRRLENALRAWFGEVEVVYEGTEHLSHEKKYVFGYHPHGLFPIGAPYMKLLSGFKRQFPDVDPVPLVASVLFYTPVIRDFCSWCGVRQVARRTFVRALRERGSVLLVPGGQAELVHTWRMFKRKEFVIYCRHKGFLRVAAEEGASVVPIAVLGEASTLRNFIDLPWLQRWSYKRIGFPVPYLLVGRWGISPFPRQTHLRFIVGQPIPMPPNIWADGKVNAEVLEEVSRQYYDAIEAMLIKHMPTFPGHEQLKLVMLR